MIITWKERPSVRQVIPSGPQLRADERGRTRYVEEQNCHHLFHCVHLSTRDERVAITPLLLWATSSMQPYLPADTEVRRGKDTEGHDENWYTVPVTDIQKIWTAIDVDAYSYISLHILKNVVARTLKSTMKTDTQYL